MSLWKLKVRWCSFVFAEGMSVRFADMALVSKVSFAAFVFVVEK